MNIALKEQVIKLRQSGKTYREINLLLNKAIPKSTMSYWCKFIEMPKIYNHKIKALNLASLAKARQKRTENNVIAQEGRIEEIIKQNEFLKQHIDTNTCKLLLSMLYLGQGIKYCQTRCLKFGSSSAVVLKLWLKLINNCYIIDSHKFRVTIMCRSDQNVAQLIEYWHNITKISKLQFYKPQIDKRSVGKKSIKPDNKGVCVIQYFNSDIQLELEILSRVIETWV